MVNPLDLFEHLGFCQLPQQHVQRRYETEFRFGSEGLGQ